jgi:signal transduction histidine kinase
MRGMFTGLRGRVTLTVFAVTACLYSLLGAIGFVQIANSGRDAIRERVTEVVDQLEAGLRSGSATVTIATPDGVEATASAPGVPVGASSSDEVRVERTVSIGGTDVVLTGRASQARLTDSLRSLFRGLWIGVPLAAAISALMAGLATRRVLRPVAAITELTHSIGPHDSETRVPVPDTGDEIEHLARTVNDMLDRIAVGRLAQRSFTSDAAHELRTPLMALQGELEIASNHPDTIDHELLPRLDALATRLGTCVDDLVLLSTLDEQRPLRLSPVSLLALLNAEIIGVGGGIDVAGGVSGGDCTVVVDAVLMARCIRNVLANARRHATSRVLATIEADAGGVWVHIDDDGAGIPDDQRALVFGRFTRLDQPRNISSGGAGLGLSIVASVAAAHGGTATVTTSALGGARFSIWIPVALDPVVLTPVVLNPGEDRTADAPSDSV